MALLVVRRMNKAFETDLFPFPLQEKIQQRFRSRGNDFFLVRFRRGVD